MVKRQHLHHAVVKTQHLHHAMVKIQIHMTFTTCRGENLDLNDIYTTSVVKRQHLHHAVVKIQIFTMLL